MTSKIVHWTVVVACLLCSSVSAAEKILFEDKFEKGLSSKWKVAGLKENEDYRIRNGGLELRVRAGKLNRETPMFEVFLPFTSAGNVIASVDVTILDKFTEAEEFAGLYLIDETGREFGAKKELVDGKLVFSPGNVKFSGKTGEEDKLDLYSFVYTAATPAAGALRIIVDRDYAHFQVGPGKGKKKYLNFFHSAIRDESEERGFALVAAVVPDKGAHWVRFDNFRVTRR